MTEGVLDVVIPTTPEEAAAAFGDGSGVTVLAGGTILMPELTHGRLKPGDLFMGLRVGITGATASPPLLPSVDAVGTEEAVRRVRATAGLIPVSA